MNKIEVLPKLLKILRLHGTSKITMLVSISVSFAILYMLRLKRKVDTFREAGFEFKHDARKKSRRTSDGKVVPSRKIKRGISNENALSNSGILRVVNTEKDADFTLAPFEEFANPLRHQTLLFVDPFMDSLQKNSSVDDIHENFENIPLPFFSLEGRLLGGFRMDKTSKDETDASSVDEINNNNSIINEVFKPISDDGTEPDQKLKCQERGEFPLSENMCDIVDKLCSSDESSNNTVFLSDLDTYKEVASNESKNFKGSHSAEKGDTHVRYTEYNQSSLRDFYKGRFLPKSLRSKDSKPSVLEIQSPMEDKTVSITDANSRGEESDEPKPFEVQGMQKQTRVLHKTRTFSMDELIEFDQSSHLLVGSGKKDGSFSEDLNNNNSSGKESRECQDSSSGIGGSVDGSLGNGGSEKGSSGNGGGENGSSGNGGGEDGSSGNGGGEGGSSGSGGDENGSSDKRNGKEDDSSGEENGAGQDGASKKANGENDGSGKGKHGLSGKKSYFLNETSANDTNNGSSSAENEKKDETEDTRSFFERPFRMFREVTKYSYYNKGTSAKKEPKRENEVSQIKIENLKVTTTDDSDDDWNPRSEVHYTGKGKMPISERYRYRYRYKTGDSKTSSPPINPSTASSQDKETAEANSISSTEKENSKTLFPVSPPSPPGDGVVPEFDPVEQSLEETEVTSNRFVPLPLSLSFASDPPSSRHAGFLEAWDSVFDSDSNIEEKIKKLRRKLLPSNNEDESQSNREESSESSQPSSGNLNFPSFATSANQNSRPRPRGILMCDDPDYREVKVAPKYMDKNKHKCAPLKHYKKGLVDQYEASSASDSPTTPELPLPGASSADQGRLLSTERLISSSIVDHPAVQKRRRRSGSGLEIKRSRTGDLDREWSQSSSHTRMNPSTGEDEVTYTRPPPLVAFNSIIRHPPDSNIHSNTSPPMLIPKQDEETQDCDMKENKFMDFDID